MYRYRRLLVAVNLTRLDVAAVRYAGMLSRLAESERVYFVHVAPSLAIPDAIRDRFPELAEVPEDAAEREMKETVTKHFDGHSGTEVRFEVTDGAPVVELLRRIRQHDVDLVVVGKAADKRDAGAVPEKLARKAPCSVMVVGENSAAQVSRILLPIDFSEPCAAALEVAAAFARAAEDVSIVPIHVYHVPIGFAKVGRTYDQFADIMHEHADEQYREFVNRADVAGLTLTPSFIAGDLPSREIERAISEHRADLVVMGARGRSDAAAILLGSATERVIRAAKVPVLAVKKKGEGMGVCKALLSM